MDTAAPWMQFLSWVHLLCLKTQQSLSETSHSAEKAEGFCDPHVPVFQMLIHLTSVVPHMFPGCLVIDFHPWFMPWESLIHE